MKIYFDTCCYGRPFDDLTDVDICVETAVLSALFVLCYRNSWTILGSTAVEFEIEQNRDSEIRNGIFLNYYTTLSETVPYSEAVWDRSASIREHGVKLLDSLHFAYAESAGADVLLTVDKGFIRWADRVGSSLPVMNPVDWFNKIGGAL